MNDHPADEPSPNGQATNGSTSAADAALRQQLATIQQEWLQPLVEQLAAANRLVGQLEAERAHLVWQRQQLEAERDALQAWLQALKRPDDLAVAVADAGAAAGGRRRAWWRVWRR